jgi:NAD(P)-dependent dehydrogenase (short-subunit alcohol dehydrogenase family)
MRLSGKIAIITGAGRGIGKAIALAFAREGACTCLASRTQHELEAVAEEISNLKQEAFVVPTDVTIEDQVKNMIQVTVNSFGQVDILVNNAGLGAFRPIYGTREKNWNHMLAVNLTSTFFGTKHVWKVMRKQGGGSIINISSLSGTRAYPLYGAYSASKWGQIGFTKTAAEEGKPYNIRVNAIAPGKVDTAMRAGVAEDKSRMLKAQDCVGSAVFLASEDSRYITGQVIEIEWFGPRE